MIYNLFLIIFLSNGVEHKVPLVKNLSDDTCIDLRDQVRGQVDVVNNLEELKEFDGSVIEFVDAECHAQKIVY